MAITPTTPKTGPAFKGLMVAMGRHAPRKLNEVVQAAAAMRALTASRRKH